MTTDRLIAPAIGSAPTAAASDATWWSNLSAKLDSPDIPGLDGIRAVAVWLVVTFHFGESVNGALGVEMFFTLSGFLITLLLLREREATGTVSLADFYIRRTRRIFPALYVFIAVGVAIYLLRGHEVPWSDVIASLFYVENYHEGIARTKDTFVGHTWSLGIEEQFYLLWPLLMLYLRHDLRKLTTALLMVIGTSWLLRMVMQYGLHTYQGYIYHAFETRMDQLAIGCLLAVLLKRFQLGGIWRRILMNPITPAIVIVCIAMSSLFHGVADYRYPVAYTVEPVLTALLILLLIAQSDHPVWRQFNHPVLRFIGRISYSLYLYQQLTLSTAQHMTENQPVFIQYAFACFVTLVFALLSYHLVEQPLRARRRGALSKHEERTRWLGTAPRIPVVCQEAGVPGLVSVLIPTYNRAYVLAKTLDSVLAQTYRPIEVVVVDDGSTDGTRELVARYGDAVRYIHQPNAGLAAARNTGLKAARGEYIALQDSDDQWAPWKLTAQVALMRRFPELALVWTDMTAVDPDDRVVRENHLAAMYDVYRLFDWQSHLRAAGTLGQLVPDAPAEVASAGVRHGPIFSAMFMGNLVHPPVAMMRRSHLARVGGLDETFAWTCEDYEFFWRVSREGTGALIEAPGMRYRVEASDQLTKPDLHLYIARGNLAALRRRLSADGAQIDLPAAAMREHLADAHAWLAEEELFSANGRRSTAIGSFVRTLIAKPGQRRMWLLFAASLLLSPPLVRAARRLKQG